MDNKLIGKIWVGTGIISVAFTAIKFFVLFLGETGPDSGIFHPVMYAINALAPFLFLASTYLGYKFTQKPVRLFVLVPLSVLGVLYLAFYRYMFAFYLYTIEEILIILMGSALFIVMPVLATLSAAEKN